MAARSNFIEMVAPHLSLRLEQHEIRQIGILTM